MTRKNGAKTEGRDDRGRFTSGNAGRPKGARHRITRAAQKLLDEDGEAVTQKAIEMALKGDSTALRLCIERICPPIKDAPVQFDIPRMRSSVDAAKAAGAILEATGQGEITPHEAASVMALVETYRRTLETSEFEQRLQAIEEQINDKPNPR